MTTTCDPTSAEYLDEADVRGELSRVFDVCQGCRRCVDLCPSFPTLFDYVDRHPDRDAGRLTPAQQDRVVDECFHCKLCAVGCPYVPGVHEQAVDVPRLMLRATAMRRAQGLVPARERATTAIMAHTDLVGRAATTVAPVANRVVSAKQGSLVRRLVEALTGVSAVRRLPTFTRQRFTTWFAARPRLRIAARQGRVAVFPTCLVEYQDPAIGHALVKVYERNGIECTIASDARCCGAPYLFAGDLKRFRKAARSNVAALAGAVRSGHEIVVPQPTCGYVLKHDYPLYAPGADAQLVAEHTHDAAEYLIGVHTGDAGALDTDFTGDVPRTVTYHAPAHLRAQDVGLRSRDLIRLTGARVTLVQQSSGVEAMWGLRAGNAERALPLAVRLGDAVRRAGGDVVAGDCHLSNSAIAEQTGTTPVHPLEIVARAYGFKPEEPITGRRRS